MTQPPMSVEQFNEEIDRRLNEVRPARYREDDTSWMQPVNDWAAQNMPPALLEDTTEEEAC
jgi:hypothetical protein